MEEIKVGEYVKTENGLIGKVNKIEPAGSGCRYAGEFLTDEIIQFNDGKIYERRVRRKQVVKHSKEVIDLIECGDYVNGMEILDIYIPRDKWDPIELRVDSRYTNFILADEIKTILTHEQFEQNSYKV